MSTSAGVRQEQCCVLEMNSNRDTTNYFTHECWGRVMTLRVSLAIPDGGQKKNMSFTSTTIVNVYLYDRAGEPIQLQHSGDFVYA